MMTQMDEINKDKHLNMILPEFIEGIGRVADKISLPPVFEHMEGCPDNMSIIPGDMTISTRKNVYANLPLHIKIETLIMMMVNVTHKKDYHDKLSAKMSKFHYTQKVAAKKTKFVAVDKPYEGISDIPTDVQINLQEDEDDEI